jgi:hypothetical protein
MRRSGFQRSSAMATAQRRATREDYEAFKRALFIRFGHRCAFCRRESLALDPHHTRKPRATYLMDPETVLPLCRRCHDLAEAAYDSSTGRLVILGSRSAGWTMVVIHARDKSEALLRIAAGRFLPLWPAPAP